MARGFIRDEGGTGVLKTVAAAHWEDDDHAGFVFARRLPLDELPSEPATFATLPAVLQQRIEPKRDLRVTVVGHQVMAAAIAGDEGEALDWRLEPDRGWNAYSLPDTESSRCVQLVADLGLGFGAIDMVCDSAGCHWFLEVNPNGEWGWLQQAAGLPVAAALASALARSR